MKLFSLLVGNYPLYGNPSLNRANGTGVLPEDSKAKRWFAQRQDENPLPETS